MTTQPNYPNIFDPTNCSLISQLLPASTKQFLFDFMNGDAFRNPVTQVCQIMQNQLGMNIAKIEFLGGQYGLTNDLRDLNTALSRANNEFAAFLAHTDRLSGLGSGQPSLEQTIGIMSAYNSIKDLLKNPGDLLEDNFSKAFSSLNPQIVGPFFENFGQNMNNISSVLTELENQLAAGGATDLADFVGQLAVLTDNINSSVSLMKGFIESDKNYYALALAFVERYVLGNTILSSSLTDSCFAAQLMKNLITTPQFSSQIDTIAQENGKTIPGSPVNLLDYLYSTRSSQNNFA